jgi:hypothetical protein
MASFIAIPVGHQQLSPMYRFVFEPLDQFGQRAPFLGGPPALSGTAFGRWGKEVCVEPQPRDETNVLANRGY